ncbi:MAG: hypothetical protein RL479_2628, partial [Verrucomicrobiota bacterium]
KLEKFEVTGSHIKRAETEGPSPIKIINRADIDVSGRTNLTDLLRELPEGGNIGINEAGTITAVRGSTALDLRGLGANNTLVIVNGRRVAPTGNNSGGTVFVDLNRFPIAMVERVEVLKDGASAIYGADATAGVVNVILRKDYSGAEVGVSYGNSFKTDVAEKTYSFFGGAASGKASATVGISYFERAALRASDTSFAKNADLSARFAARGPAYADNVAAGAFDLRSGTGPQARIGLTGAAAGQVNGVNGVNIPGLAAGTAITRLPGTGGVVAGTLASASPNFASANRNPTGGAFNAAAAGTFEPQRLAPQGNPSNLYNFQEFVWLTPSTERLGINTTFRYDLTKDVSFYVETAYQQNKSHIELAPSPISTSPPRATTTSSSRRPITGIRSASTCRSTTARSTSAPAWPTSPMTPGASSPAPRAASSTAGTGTSITRTTTTRSSTRPRTPSPRAACAPPSPGTRLTP